MQRLFLALGVHAERGLPIRTGQRQISTASDVDVLAISYAPNFHRSVFHAECKGGHSAKAFDRVFWLAGMRRLLGADRSLLVIPSYDRQVSEFARSLEVEVLHLDTIRRMEQAYQIPRDWWPARSQASQWDPLLHAWSAFAALPEMHPDLAVRLKEVYLLVYEEGWRVFSYALLDRLLGLLREIGRLAGAHQDNGAVLHVTRLAVSCGLVRLGHLLLGVCQDLLARQPGERVQCLTDRLTFGDHAADDLRRLLERSSMLLAGAAGEGGELPPWNPARVFPPPEYQPLLLKLVQRLMSHPERGIYLPYALEMLQFGYASEPRGAVEAWVDVARPAADAVKAFIGQALHVPPTLLAAPSPRVLADALHMARAA